jgi:hypothetical protein
VQRLSRLGPNAPWDRSSDPETPGTDRKALLAAARAQTSSDLLCFAAARFSVRRSFSVFWAGFLPTFFGFC